MSAANMSPVPEKKTGKAGTVRRKRRGLKSEVAVDPTIDSLAVCCAPDPRLDSPEGVDARDMLSGVEAAVAGSCTEVMMTCGTRKLR